MNATQGKILEKADILAKFEREVHRQLKKMDGINPKLFNQLEDTTAKDECGFDMDGGEDSEGDNEGSLIETNEERDLRKLKEENKRSMLRNVKESSRNTKDDDIDIDTI